MVCRLDGATRLIKFIQSLINVCLNKKLLYSSHFTMSSVLELYIEEIEGDLQKVDEQAALGKECNEKTCKALFKKIQDTEKQAKIELRLIDKTSELRTRFNTLQNKIALKKREVDKILLTNGADSTVFNGLGKSATDRKRVEAINEKVERQNETIERLQGVVADTEIVGAEILTELSENREKIESARDKTKEVNTDLSDAESRMRRMQRRADAGGCQIM